MFTYDVLNFKKITQKNTAKILRNPNMDRIYLTFKFCIF